MTGDLITTTPGIPANNEFQHEVSPNLFENDYFYIRLRPSPSSPTFYARVRPKVMGIGVSLPSMTYEQSGIKQSVIEKAIYGDFQEKTTFISKFEIIDEVRLDTNYNTTPPVSLKAKSTLHTGSKAYSTTGSTGIIHGQSVLIGDKKTDILGEKNIEYFHHSGVRFEPSHYWYGKR